MGALSSCFGRDRSGDDTTDETRRLLHTPYQGGYGAAAHAGADAQDSEAVRREREALEGIYHSLSDNVFDVFSAQAQHAQSQTMQSRSGSQTPSHAQSKSHLRDGQDPSTAAGHLYSRGDMGENGDDNLASEELRMRTIRKPRSGPMFIATDKSAAKLAAVQAAMG